MWPRESAEFCPACGTVTPHARQRLRAGYACATLAAIFGLWLGLRARSLLAAGMAGFIALWLALRERDTRAGIACQRCRSKALERLRAEKPNPKNSTIDIG